MKVCSEIKLQSPQMQEGESLENWNERAGRCQFSDTCYGGWNCEIGAVKKLGLFERTPLKAANFCEVA